MLVTPVLSGEHMHAGAHMGNRLRAKIWPHFVMFLIWLATEVAATMTMASRRIAGAAPTPSV
jgi:hypothetical protein